MKPIRIQLRRKKGWRLPANTIVVTRATKFGNPFIVGKHGTQAECVESFRLLTRGIYSFGPGPDNFKEQKAFLEHMKKNLPNLRGKNLACFCKEGTPCHGTVLLEIASMPSPFAA
jgi:hypothetical protein